MVIKHRNQQQIDDLEKLSVYVLRQSKYVDFLNTADRTADTFQYRD